MIPEPIDFEHECDQRTSSWTRSDGLRSLIEPFGRYGFRVLLPDSETVHYLALGIENGDYIGRCDCKGWEYHDGPCSHLCSVRKAEYIGRVSVNHADRSPEDRHQFSQESGECFRGSYEEFRRGSELNRARTHTGDPTLSERDGGVCVNRIKSNAVPRMTPPRSVNTNGEIHG